MSAKKTAIAKYLELKAAKDRLATNKSQVNWRAIRLGLFTSLLVLAPFSKYPYIALPAFNFSSFRIGFYQLLAGLFILFCLWPALKQLKPLYKQNKLAFISIIVLAVVAIAGLFRSLYFARSALLALSILFLLLLVLIAWWFIVNEFQKGYFKPIVEYFLMVGIAFSLIGIVQFVFVTLSGESLGILCKNCTSAIFGFPRINGLAAEPQFYANSLLPVFFVSVGWVYIKKTRLAVVALSASALAITLTFSRGAFIAVAGGLFAYLVLTLIAKKQDLKQLGQVMLLIILCFIAGISLLVASATYRYRTTPNISYNTFVSMVDHLTLGVIDIPQKQAAVVAKPASTANFTPPGLIQQSSQDRLGAAQLALKAWRSSTYSVAFGVGAGNLGPYTVKHIDASAPDNLTVYIYYVLVLSELGLVGLLALASIYLSGIYSYTKRYFKDKNSALYMTVTATLVAFLIQYSFFGTYINTVYIWLWAGIILGLAGLPAAKKLYNRKS
jgi:hypothetical protein